MADNDNMAKLTITFGGQQGDLPDPVSYDAGDGDIKQWATEAVRQGNVPGIDAAPDVNFTDFVVDRFPSRADVPFNRLSLRPKTPFGLEGGHMKELRWKFYNTMFLVFGKTRYWKRMGYILWS